MKIAFSTHAARSYPSGRWGGLPGPEEQELLFDWVAEQAFAGVEIADSWIDFDRLDQAAAEAMRTRAEERGLSICALNLLRKVLCAPAHTEKHEAAIRHAIDLATWMGGAVVSISLSHPTAVHGVSAVTGTTHSPGGSREATDADYEATAKALRPLAARADGLGIALSVELHHCSIADTSAGLLRVLDLTDARNIGANPDLINGMWAYAEPPETWQEALVAVAPRVNLWHMKNAQRVYVPESRRAVFIERPLSQGDVDYRWGMARMRAAGFDGWISIENCGNTDPFETISVGRAYLASLAAAPKLERLATLGAMPSGPHTDSTY